MANKVEKLKVKSSVKEQQIQKRKIYEKLNESVVQTKENYENVVMMTGKGAEKKYSVEYKIDH